MNRNYILLLLLMSLTMSGYCQDRPDIEYRCFVNDKNPKLGFTVKFVGTSATYIKYFGQSEWIKLIYVNESTEVATTIVLFKEMKKGQKTGEYNFIYWGTTFYITYQRTNDKEELTFNEISPNDILKKPCQ